MNFDQLKIFISVVENGSFTKAAETLYISHSTTSRNVSALEESLGVRLLARDCRSVRLTTAGETLFREGQLLLQKAQELEAIVRNADSGSAGRLTVASVSLYSQALSLLYKAFCKRFPDMIFGIYHRELSEIFGQVLGGEADVGVTLSYVLPQDADGFEMTRVGSERFCLITPGDHPFAQRKSVEISELRADHYVSVGKQRSAFVQKLEDALWQGRSKSGILYVPTLESLFLQVQSGNRVSLVPYPMAKEYGANCAIVNVEDLDTDFDIVAFWRKDNDNPSLKLFAQLLTEMTEK